MKIVHITSVHSRYDTRIFLKECQSLACVPDYQVSLLVSDGIGGEAKCNVHIIDMGNKVNRLKRIFFISRSLYRIAIHLRGNIYHLHDPELIPIGLRLLKKGKIVIFDAHEDLPKQILTKPYLNRGLKWCLSRILACYEARVCGQFDAIVAATPAIRDKFLRINPHTVDINNFPILKELETPVSSWNKRKPHVCYIGGITEIRGIREMVRVMEHVQTDARLQLAGTFSEPDVEAEVGSYPGWQRVDRYGFVNRETVKDILASGMVGIVIFHPAPNHLEAQPNKMFEYMSAGIPVIASDFPLWRKIIDGNQCGICVDPLNVSAIGRAIDFLLEHPDEAEAMGSRGRKAIQEQFNWKIEEKKLIQLYEQLSEAA